MRRRITFEIDTTEVGKWSDWLRTSDSLASLILETTDERDAVIDELSNVGIKVLEEPQRKLSVGFFNHGGYKLKYPWHELEVGESFKVYPEEGQTLDQKRSTMVSLIQYTHKKMHPRRFSMRTMREQSPSYIQVWRTQ